MLKKAAMVLVILMFCLAGKVLAGGVYIDFEIPDPKTKAFAEEFISEMQKKKNHISFFIGEYFVRGYLGVGSNPRTGETKSMIGIFIDEDKEPFFIIFCDELFSGNEIIKKARKAADDIFEYLKRKEEKRKKSIKIPV